MLSTGKVAKLRSVTPDTVLKWIKGGQLPAIRTAGGHYRIARRDLDGHLERRLPFENAFEIMRMPVHRYGTALFRAQLRPSVSRLGRALIDGRARRRA